MVLWVQAKGWCLPVALHHRLQVWPLTFIADDAPPVGLGDNRTFAVRALSVGRQVQDQRLHLAAAPDWLVA